MESRDFWYQKLTSFLIDLAEYESLFLFHSTITNFIMSNGGGVES